MSKKRKRFEERVKTEVLVYFLREKLTDFNLALLVGAYGNFGQCGECLANTQSFYSEIYNPFWPKYPCLSCGELSCDNCARGVHGCRLQATLHSPSK